MIKIFWFGLDILKKEYEDILESSGATITKFKSIDNITHKDNYIPDVIIADKNQSGESTFREFIKRYRDVPRIVLSATGSFRGFAPWTRHTLTYPLNNPPAKVLKYYIERAKKERELLVEHFGLKNKLLTFSHELDFFEEVSRTLTSTLNLNQILNTILQKAKKLIMAESGSILLLDEETGELFFEKETGRKKNKGRVSSVRIKAGKEIAGWVAREGVPVIIPDVSGDQKRYSGLNKKIAPGIKSLMCVPIKIKNTTLGVIEIANKTSDRAFTRNDLDLLLKLVAQAAIAIERASLYQKMAEQSITDDLTSLFNTRYLQSTLETEIARSDRYHTPLSLIFIDIDYFKAINDNYGHLTGSKTLVEIGQLLIKGLRSIDVVVRYGGDEFVVVLPQTSHNHALQIAERLRKSIIRHTFLKKEGYSFRLTASFGVTTYPESAKTKEDLLILADEAMYKVKYQTRNGVYGIV
ncbi:MAG: sensor domain-containing diguanylate cyclase [Nitrospirota bacterium]|nr:sensor domain-containing diguanylate cyclase [Nitrospirota bacterium]